MNTDVLFLRLSRRSQLLNMTSCSVVDAGTEAVWFMRDLISWLSSQQMHLIFIILVLVLTAVCSEEVSKSSTEMFELIRFFLNQRLAPRLFGRDLLLCSLK